MFPHNQSLLHFHWQNLYFAAPSPFSSKVPYWSHLILVVNKFCIIWINTIFVIIAKTKLTQARKILFINTILFRSHIHYLMNFVGNWYGPINSRRWEGWLIRFNIFFRQMKKISDSAFSYAHLSLLLSVSHCKTDTVQLHFV